MNPTREIGDGMFCIIGNVASFFVCKEKEEKIRKVGRKRGIKHDSDVGYYSEGGPNHSKNSCPFIFPLNFHLIVASRPRGADHGVSSNFTPIDTIKDLAIFAVYVLKI